MAFWAFPGETLRVRVISSVAQEVRVRIRLVDGRALSRTFTPASTRTSEVFDGQQTVQESGEVVSLTAEIASADRGQCYLDVSLFDGLLANTLAKGYVYDGHGLSLGEFVEPGPGGGDGAVRSIDLGDPAAGADYASQTVPTNAQWRVVGFAGTLVGAVVAASRRFAIDFTDGTVVVAGTSASEELITGETHAYRGSLAGNLTATTGAGADGNISLILPNLVLPEGFVVDFATLNLQVTDDWGDGQMLVEEWLVI